MPRESETAEGQTYGAGPIPGKNQASEAAQDRRTRPSEGKYSQETTELMMRLRTRLRPVSFNAWFSGVFVPSPKVWR